MRYRRVRYQRNADGSFDVVSYGLLARIGWNVIQIVLVMIAASAVIWLVVAIWWFWLPFGLFCLMIAAPVVRQRTEHRNAGKPMTFLGNDPKSEKAKARALKRIQK